MDLITRVDISAPAAVVFFHLDDLSRYPAWAPLVHSVGESAPHDDGAPAWDVELRAKVGPFARSKRLRMIRVRCDAPRTVEFVRAEIDGRPHAPWHLRATVTEAASGVDVELHLHYGGSLWGPVLERVLADQVAAGREGLRRVVADRG
jgi:hypothetical protein